MTYLRKIVETTVSSLMPLRVFQEVVFGAHRWQFIRTPIERGIIHLPDPLKRGNDPALLDKLLERVIAEFTSGKNTVVISVGNSSLSGSEYLCFRRKTLGAHAADFFQSQSTLERLSSQAGKRIEVYEGLKRYGEDRIEYYKVGSEYQIGKEDTSYVVLKAGTAQIIN